MSGVKVDFKPSIAQVERTMDEIPHGVLQSQSHENWPQDWKQDDTIHKFVHAPDLCPLAVNYNDVS